CILLPRSPLGGHRVLSGGAIRRYASRGSGCPIYGSRSSGPRPRVSGPSVMHVRYADASDEGRLFELVREFPAQTVPDAATFAVLLKAKLEDSASYIALAAQGEQIVGYVAGYRHPTFYASGETAWVDELFVDP